MKCSRLNQKNGEPSLQPVVQLTANCAPNVVTTVLFYYTVPADRLYVLCHVIQCLQTDCMYCVMLHSVCRQTVCTVSCYTVSATDCMYCVMLHSVCDRLHVLCHVILYKNTVIKIITFFSARQFSKVIYTRFQCSLPMTNSINCMVPCQSITPSPKEHKTQPKNILKYLSYLLLYQPIFSGCF